MTAETYHRLRVSTRPSERIDAISEIFARYCTYRDSVGHPSTQPRSQLYATLATISEPFVHVSDSGQRLQSAGENAGIMSSPAPDQNTTESLENNDYRLRRLFDGYVFHIPEYQRFYSWNRQHWDDLWHDLLNDLDG